MAPDVVYSCGLRPDRKKHGSGTVCSLEHISAIKLGNNPPHKKTIATQAPMLAAIVLLFSKIIQLLAKSVSSR